MSRDTWTERARTNWQAATGGSEWPQSDTDRLCDMIADGLSFGSAGAAIGKTPGACKSRFYRLARKFGRQAR